jgi:hypothetical protein
VGPEWVALLAVVLAAACFGAGFGLASWGYSPRLEFAQAEAAEEKARRERYEKQSRARALGAREDLAEDRVLRAAVGAADAWERLLEHVPSRAELAALAVEPGPAGDEGGSPGSASEGSAA